MDDRACPVAASARLGDARALKAAVAELRETYPGFDLVRFTASLPYQHDRDHQAVLDALKAAQLNAT
jgi:hypothetical protein